MLWYYLSPPPQFYSDLHTVPSVPTVIKNVFVISKIVRSLDQIIRKWKDYTIFAVKDGVVQFETDKSTKFISVC